MYFILPVPKLIFLLLMIALPLKASAGEVCEEVCTKYSEPTVIKPGHTHSDGTTVSEYIEEENARINYSRVEIPEQYVGTGCTEIWSSSGSAEGNLVGSTLMMHSSIIFSVTITGYCADIDDSHPPENLELDYEVPTTRSCLVQEEVCKWENECPDLYDTNLASCSGKSGVLENWSCSENPTPPQYDFQCKIPEVELPSEADPDKNKGPDCDGEGNPCSPSSGNKFESFIDYKSANGQLTVIRNYNSLNPSDGKFGMGWTGDTLSSLKITSSTIAIHSKTGRVETWGWALIPSGPRGERVPTFFGPSDTKIVLFTTGGHFSVKNTDNSIDTFNGNGNLLSSKNTAGLITLYSYDANERLSKTTDPYGRTLSYQYDNNGHISAILTPDGVISYSYDSLGNLTQATYPDLTTEKYHYENTTFAHSLTGITDENNVRFATWTYTNDGKAETSEHAGEVEKTSFAYITNEHNDVTETTVTGALGDARPYNFKLMHGVYKVVSITGDQCTSCGNGSMKTRDYDDRGFLSSYIDWNGNETTFQNNSRGLVTLSIEYNGSDRSKEIRRTTIIWHSTLRVPLSITRANSKEAYTYTSGGKLLTRTTTDLSTDEARTTTYAYHPVGVDGEGLLASINGPRDDVDDVTYYEYDVQGNLKQIINALGHTTQITSHDASGRPLVTVDANDVTTSMSWDLRGRLLTTDVAGSTTSFEYDAVGQLKKLTQADGSYLKYSYDDARRLIEISDNLNNKVSYTLDNMGNRLSTNMKDVNGTISTFQTTIFDKLSRLQQSLGANNQQQTYSYDNNHNPLGKTDALSRQTLSNYDSLDRLIKSVDPDAKEINFEYDLQDNLTKVIDAKGLETTYSYNGFDEKVSQISPDTGTTTYTYDSAGNATSMTDARGVIVSYSYDALNRLTVIDYSDDSLDVTHIHDLGANGKGRLSQTTDASGISDYSYDLRGNLISKTVQLQAQSYTTQYRYNEANRLIGMTYPDGLVVDYRLDAVGRITNIDSTADSVTQNIVNTISYLPFGPIDSLTYGNGLLERRTHDNSYRLNQLTIGALVNTQYIHDSVDNIEAITNTQNAANDQIFFYDVLDRIVSETGSYGERSYQYDAVSNRTQRTKNFEKIDGEGNLQPKTTTQNYSLDTASHHLNSINNRAISYDLMGNTTSINNGKKAFAFNEAGRMMSFTKEAILKAEYLYNGMGQRTVKLRHKDDGTQRTFHYHYDQQGQLLAETKYDKLGRKRLSREYIWLNNKPVAQLKTRYRANGNVKDRVKVYIHTDHLNAPSKATNDAQQVVWEWNHEAFGLGRADNDPDADDSKTNIPLRFSGQYKDGESGLFYNYFRYYNPQAGRYMTSDPIGLAGGINTYGYVEGNPLSFVDPLGLKTFISYAGPHPFVTIENSSNPSINGTWNFGPDKSTFTQEGYLAAWILGIPIPGQVSAGNPVWFKTELYNGTDALDQEIYERIQESIINPPEYSWSLSNCIEWAHDVITGNK